MKVMSIERFREIKKIFHILKDYDEGIIEDIDEEIEQQCEAAMDELHYSDLSQIPAEEYEEFYDPGVDFEGTGANLDFQIINEEYREVPIKLKGCNFSNFDFETIPYDEESFEEEFILTNKKHFWGMDEEHPIPKEVRDRYNHGQLTLEDIYQYDLWDSDATTKVNDSFARGMIRYFSVAILKQIQPDIELWRIITTYIYFRNEIQIDSMDAYNQVLKEKLIEKINGNLKPEEYEKLISFEKVRELIPEYIIDFGENQELKEKYFSREISPGTIIKYPEIFRGKKVLARNFRYSIREDITEEKIYYLLEHFPKLIQDLKQSGLSYLYLNDFISCIDLTQTKEENFQNLQEVRKKILQDQSLYTGDFKERANILVRSIYSLKDFLQENASENKELIETVLRYTSPEKVDEMIDRDLFIQWDVLSVFKYFGFETVMEFDQENGGIFTKDNGKLLKSLYDHYLHYDNNNHDPESVILHRSLHDTAADRERPYTKEEFEESVVRMIRQGYDGKNEIDYRNFSDGFRTRHPEMFLPKDIPEDDRAELEDKFYSRTLTLQDIENHPHWRKYIEKTDFSYGIKNYSMYIYPFIGAIKYLTRQFPRKDAMDFLMRNKKYIEFFYEVNQRSRDYLDLNSASTIEEFEEKFFDTLTNMIIQNNSNELVTEDGIGEKKDQYTREQKMMYLNVLASFETQFLTKDDFGRISRINIENPSEEDFRNYIEEYIINRMKTGVLQYNDEIYPSFAKERCPELFLDEDAPEDLKTKFYTKPYGKNTYTPDMDIDEIVNPKYRNFLVGKHIPKPTDRLKYMLETFTFNEICEFADIDQKATKIYSSTKESIGKFKSALETYPVKFAKEEIMNAYHFVDENDCLEQLEKDPQIKEEYQLAIDKYKKAVISMPGLFLHGPEELTKADIRNYQVLTENNSLRQSPHFRRDIYEQIIAHMYGLLGVEEARKLLAPPSMEPENLDAIFEMDGRIKDLYEKKFELTGNIKVLTSLLSRIPSILPENEKITSKNTLNIFQKINHKIMNGYEGDINKLLKEVLEETGQPINDQAVHELVNNVIRIHTNIKLDKIKEFTSAQVEAGIEENAKTRRMIKLLYREALEYSLNQSEKIDPELVREFLEEEFAKTNENGAAHYSEHVTMHLEELVNFAEELLQNPEHGKMLNQTIITSLKEESQKIGKGWIRKILQASNYPLTMSYDEMVQLDNSIYGENSQFEIDTKETVGIRELSEDERKSLYTILEQAEFSNILTFNKAEIMFSALIPPFSEEFKKFFLENKDEFLTNPKYFSNFKIMHDRFDRIISDPLIRTRYDEGLFTVESLYLESKKVTYSNTEKGEFELDYKARKGPLLQEQYDIAKRLFKEMKKREASTVPPEQHTTSRFRGRVVRIDDPLHLAIGEITDCCQTIGLREPGESSMIHSAIEQNGGLFIVEELDENGTPKRIVAQSWMWRNGNRLTFDNVEIPSETRQEYSQIGGYDGIMEAYVGAAQKMIETDTKALQKLVTLGKITEEEFSRLVIKDVTMGTGCDDLIHNLSSSVRRNFSGKGLPIVTPLENAKHYFGSKERDLYSDSRHGIILIAHNDLFDQKDHEFYPEEVIEHGIKYTKIRDIYRRNGKDIDSDKIEVIRNMVMRNENSNDSIFNENTVLLVDIIQTIYPYQAVEIDSDKFELSMSECGDWFILTEEKDNKIIVHDSGIDLSQPITEETRERDKIDRKMSIAEYTRELLVLSERASQTGKKLVIDLEKEGKYLQLDSLINSGEWSVAKDGTVTITDPEKLHQRILDLEEILEHERRERILSDIGENPPDESLETEEEDIQR